MWVMDYRNGDIETESGSAGLPCLLRGLGLSLIALLLISFWSGSVALAAQCGSCGGSGRCRPCGGSGRISAGSIRGQPAAYGCTACGGFRGDPLRGPPGRPGNGRCRTCGGTGRIGGTTRPPGTTPPKGPTPIEIARQKAHAAALKLNTTGCGHYKNRRWQDAIDAFVMARAKWPENTTFKKNLANARAARDSEKFKAASSAAESRLFLALAEGQVRELEDVDRQIRNLFKARQAKVNQEFVGQAKTGNGFQARKRETLLSMGLDPEVKRNGQLPWEAGIRNPQIARIMRGVGSIEVPPPLPSRKVSLSWHRIATEHGTGILDTGSDVGFLVWDLFGRIGSKAPFAAKVLVIAGKTFIAGEDGAMVHLIKQEGIYQEALGYLKDSATRQKFARLVHSLKENGTAPADTDPRMLRAAKAINDPKLGSSGTRLAWGAMASPEAKAAMVRKASLEIGVSLIDHGTGGILADLNKQKKLYTATRLERRKARVLLRETTDPIERDQLKKIIAHTNYVTAKTYRLERSGPILGNYAIGKVGGRVIKDQGDLKTIRVKTGSGSN
jgi:hypothetical protein